MVEFLGDRPPGNIGANVPGDGPGAGGRRDTLGLDVELSQRLDEMVPMVTALAGDAVRQAVSNARTTGVATGVVSGVENDLCLVQMDDGGVPGADESGFVSCLRMNPGIVAGSRVRVHFEGAAMAEAHGPIAQSPSPAILPTVLFTSSQNVSSASITNAALSISAESGDFDWEISGTTIFLPSGGFFLTTVRSVFAPNGSGVRFMAANTAGGTLLTGDQGTGMAIFSTGVSGAGIWRADPGDGVSVPLFQNSGSTLNVTTRFSLSLVGDRPV